MSGRMAPRVSGDQFESVGEKRQHCLEALPDRLRAPRQVQDEGLPHGSSDPAGQGGLRRVRQPGGPRELGQPRRLALQDRPRRLGGDVAGPEPRAAGRDDQRGSLRGELSQYGLDLGSLVRHHPPLDVAEPGLPQQLRGHLARGVLARSPGHPVRDRDHHRSDVGARGPVVAHHPIVAPAGPIAGSDPRPIRSTLEGMTTEAWNPPTDDAPAAGPLVDTLGRVANDLRVSVTDRCNFRCTYCMPAEGLVWLPKPEILTFEEMSQTLADAGLDRVTVSCDSLMRHRFAEMTRRDALERVLAGLEAAEAAGLTPIKLNVVVIGGTNEDEAVEFARFARRTGYEVRFIEYMPLDADRAWERAKVVPSARLLRQIDAEHSLTPDHGPEPATTYRFADGAPGAVGVIPSVTEPFCDTCNRLRLTADGQFRSCLFALEEADLRDPLRAGASDEELAALLRAGVWRKWPGHRINHPDFVQPERSMSMIGG